MTLYAWVQMMTQTKGINIPGLFFLIVIYFTRLLRGIISSVFP